MSKPLYWFAILFSAAFCFLFEFGLPFAIWGGYCMITGHVFSWIPVLILYIAERSIVDTKAILDTLIQNGQIDK